MEGVTLNSDVSFSVLSSLEIYKSLLNYDLIANLGLREGDFENIQKKLEPLQNKMRNIVMSKEYLDKIKNESKNLNNEKKWQKLIDSFSIEKI